MVHDDAEIVGRVALQLVLSVGDRVQESNVTLDTRGTRRRLGATGLGDPLVQHAPKPWMA